MARPITVITPEQDLFWVDALRALEAGETTREMIMSIGGISGRTLERRLARAREVREDFDEAEPDERDDDKLPYLALTSSPERERGDWYDLESGLCTVERGSVRVSNRSATALRVRSITGGRPVDLETGSKSHNPTDGLKGGVG
jgi:hypothetical protein